MGLRALTAIHTHMHTCGQLKKKKPLFDTAPMVLQIKILAQGPESGSLAVPGLESPTFWSVTHAFSHP